MENQTNNNLQTLHRKQRIELHVLNTLVNYKGNSSFDYDKGCVGLLF